MNKDKPVYILLIDGKPFEGAFKSLKGILDIIPGLSYRVLVREMKVRDVFCRLVDCQVIGVYRLPVVGSRNRGNVSNFAGGE